MKAVSSLIFNSLAEGHGITLPGVGSLWIKPFSAREIRPGRIMPPGRQVVFSAQESDNLHGIVNEIAASGNVSQAEAAEIYGRWKDAAVSDKTVIIEGVGRISGGHFKPTEELDAILCPFGHEVVKLKRTGRGKRTFTAILILLIIAAAGSGYMWYMDMIAIPGLPAATELSAAKTETPATGIRRNTDTPAQPRMQDSVARDTTGRESAEDSIARSLMADAIASKPQVAEATAPRTAETSQSQSSGTQQGSNYSVIPEQDIFHVVGGVYSTEANADKFIASSQAKNDTLHYVKIPTSRGRTIVSIYQSNDREEALRAMRRLNRGNGSLWIHTERKK